VYRITPTGRRALKEWLGSPSKPGLAVDLEGLVRVFLGNFSDPGDLSAAVEQTRADAAGLVNLAHEIAQGYIEGRAPFQPHVHVRAFVFDFLFTFGHMVRDWSERTARDLDEWKRLDLDQRRELGKARIAQAIADRPKLPTLGPMTQAHRRGDDDGAPKSPPPRRRRRVRSDASAGSAPIESVVQLGSRSLRPLAVCRRRWPPE
jgi:hypothetical protein